jgi:hypothetical protein
MGLRCRADGLPLGELVRPQAHVLLLALHCRPSCRCVATG